MRVRRVASSGVKDVEIAVAVVEATAYMPATVETAVTAMIAAIPFDTRFFPPAAVNFLPRGQDQG